MRRFLPLTALVLPLALTFCRDKSFNLVPVANGAVTILDNCDSVSFNAALGPGTCVKAGTTTLSAFTAELTATRQVTGWQFVPSTFTITTNGVINAFNSGGELHTFTAVAAFGGGSNPAINSLAGTPVEAPECVNAAANQLIAPGATFTTSPVTTTGLHLYQCCIHPWMRANVTVVNQ